MSLDATRAPLALSLLLLVSLGFNVFQHVQIQIKSADRERMTENANDLQGFPGFLESSHSRSILRNEQPSDAGRIYTGPVEKYNPYVSFVDKHRRGAGYLVPPGARDEMGQMLEFMGGFHVGVELGVQRGEFANVTLSTWPSCKKYYLVDLWAQQKNYEDFANVADKEQEEIYQTAKSNLKQFESKTVFIRNYTTSAAPMIPDNLDFVYVDARHDYLGVTQDLETYWPKIRPGGIMAGHDYVAAWEVKEYSNQDWSLCGDGTINYGAVRGAVDEFALKHGLFVSVTNEDYMWKSWIIRKPYACSLGSSI